MQVIQIMLFELKKSGASCVFPQAFKKTHKSTYSD